MDIRFVSIVCVFLCSLVGSVGAYLISKCTCLQSQWFKSLITMFSAGMMLSLAFVHITNDVILEFKEYTSLPLGASMILSGLMVMTIIEHASHSFKPSHTDIEAPLLACSRCAQTNPEEHSHECISILNSSALLYIIDDNKQSYKNRLSLLMLEVACVFHSLFIGVSLGLSSMSETFIPLSIALCFHQLLEGVSVGSLSSEANISTIKVVLFTFIYSITAPLGIAIGMFVDNTLINNKTSQIIVLSFQGFAGGMLMYVALFQMVAEELSKKETHNKLSTLQKLSIYIALVCGASSMCIIALWL